MTGRLGRALVAAVVATVALILPAHPPHARAAEGDLVVVAQTFSIDINSPWAITVQVPADLATAAPDPIVVQITAHQRLSSRLGLREATDGDLPATVDAVELPLAALPRPQPDQLQIAVPTEADADEPTALRLSEPGLYPVTIDVVIDDEVTSSVMTFIHRMPAADEPALQAMQIAMTMATLEPVELDDDAQPILSEAALAELLQLTDVLERIAISTSVAVSPATLGALRTADPALADRLTSALQRHQLLALPSLPLDVSAAAAAGQSARYTEWLRDGEDQLGTLVAATTVRTSSIVAEPLSTAGGSLLRDLGSRLLVLSPERYAELDGNLGLGTDTSQLLRVGLDSGAALEAIVVDNGLAIRFEATDDPFLNAVFVAADLIVTREQIAESGQNPSRHSMILAVPNLGVPDPDSVVAITQLIAATPGLSVVTLDDVAVQTNAQLIDGREVSISLPDTTEADITQRIAVSDQLAFEAASMASMLPATDARTARWNRTIAVMPSTALTDRQTDELRDALAAEFAAIRAAIDVPDPFEFTLTGRDSTIRLRFRNTSDTALSIRVRLTSPKLLFPNGDQVVELAPNTVTDVPVDVTARSNGKTPVSLDVFTPVGDLEIAPRVPLAGRVNALSGLANLITGAALLVVMAWWARHWQTGRRRKAAEVALARHPVGNGNGNGNVHDDPASDRPPLPDDDLSPDAAASTLPPS